MLDEMRKQDHLPRRLRAQTEGMKNARKKLANELGREPTNEELCEVLDIDISQLANLQGLTQPIVDIQKIEPYHEETDNSPFALLENKELKGMVMRSIGTLPERLQLVLSLHYVEALTYREIGHSWGIRTGCVNCTAKLHRPRGHRSRRRFRRLTHTSGRLKSSCILAFF